jgi:hypothetical protein
MKFVVLFASYDHVINNDADLQKLIDCTFNDYDLHKFRAWNDFFYEFEPSDKRGWYHVKIFEKESGKEVWKCCI